MGRYFSVATFYLFITVISAGCSGTTISAHTTSKNFENQIAPIARTTEEIEQLLVGSWYGYIKSTIWTHIAYNKPTLRILRVRNGDDGWTADVLLNRKRPSRVTLDIHPNGISMEILEIYGNLLIWYNLNFSIYGNEKYLEGGVTYGKKSFTPAGISFQKMSDI